MSDRTEGMVVPKSVIIVGAGAAGIAAASKLVASNACSITILEAENRIGGRICTVPYGADVVDLGAQWVHGEEGNVAHELGTSADLLANDSYDLYSTKYIYSDGTVLDAEYGAKLMEACNKILHDDQNRKGSVGQYFDKRIKEELKKVGVDYPNPDADAFVTWFARFQNSCDGSDSWYETAAAMEYRECAGNSLTRWKTGGYKNILNLLMGKNKDKIHEKIIYNKKVKTVRWGEDKAEVVCVDGEKMMADHVLVTVSLGVLKENYTDMFNPPLPLKKINAIQGLSIGTVDKIFIKFPYRWWPIDCPGFSLLWKENDILSKEEGGWSEEVFGFYSVEGNPEVLCGWLVGPAARQMEQCTDVQVLDDCYRLLLRFLNSQYQIPAPESIVRSKWHSNSNFRGSYSFRSVTTEEKNACAADLASPLPLAENPVLMFCGEATHDYLYSSVNGAIETGWREADRLLSHLQNRF